MVDKLKDLFVGINLPPVVVAAARAVLHAAVLAAVGEIQHQADLLSWTDYAKIAPLVLIVQRIIEGAIDNWLTPNQNDVPPPKAPTGKKSGAET